MIKKFEEFTNKVNEAIGGEQFTPIIAMDPDELKIDNITVLASQPTFDDAVEKCISYITEETGMEFESYDTTEVKDGVQLVTLHFLFENDDPDETEEDMGPADEYCYIFVSK